MCGVKVTMHTEPLLDQNGVTKIFLYVWFTLQTEKNVITGGSNSILPKDAMPAFHVGLW